MHLRIAVTGFHSRWNKRVEVRHPNIWVFIRKLKDEEKHVRHRVRAAEQGEPAPRRKRRYRLLEERVQRLRREYGVGARCVDEYWRAVAHSVHHF